MALGSLSGQHCYSLLIFIIQKQQTKCTFAIMVSIEKLYDIYKSNPLISTDSRSIIPGSLFFALRGPNFNGNSFAEMALSKGAAYVVIDEAAYQKNHQHLLVDDALKALQSLANYHRHQLKIPFLAITGSNGKTTTKELIRNVLSKKYRTVATKGNLNNHIGVPLTILTVTMDTEFAVIEMGANHQKEIDSYCQITEPDYGLITNVGKAHLEGFGGFEGVKKGKGELYSRISRHGKSIFLNGNNGELDAMIKEYKFSRIIRYGTDQEFYCSGELVSEQPLLKINWKCENKKGTINSQLVGYYNFENILSAVCVGNYFDVNPDDINDAIETYIPGNSRSQIIKKNSNTIILDAYNANPTSMEAALNNFRKISASHKIVFLGDMAELGEESFEEHKRIATILNGDKYDKVILVGKNFGEFSDGFNRLHFDDSGNAASWLKKNPIENSFILIKGSRPSQMEKIMEAL